MNKPKKKQINLQKVKTKRKTSIKLSHAEPLRPIGCDKVGNKPTSKTAFKTPSLDIEGDYSSSNLACKENFPFGTLAFLSTKR